jgi:hypothetical protein
MKIAKIIKLYFKVSMTRVDNNRIERLQVNYAKMNSIEFEIDVSEDVEPKPKTTRSATKISTNKGLKYISIKNLQ